MKTLLEHLNDVSKERGFRDFRHCTDDGRVYVVEDIIETSGKRYALEACKEALKNAVQSAESAARKERSMSRVYLKMYEAIESETNILEEVRNGN